MIDDYKKTMKLIKYIEKNLPIFAYPAKNLVHSLRENNNQKIKAKEKLRIDRVLYLGDEGGIGCYIMIKNEKKALIVSLTHLRIEKRHPLFKEIRAYQLERIRKLGNSTYLPPRRIGS
ncbi:MAG: hypothetical protein LJE91_03085 [Gammaproteobacteria bacterium]|nr:hypothetical protein [Gammaproteobacteria bacterium]